MQNMFITRIIVIVVMLPQSQKFKTAELLACMSPGNHGRQAVLTS